MKKVLVGQPYYGTINPVSFQCARRPISDGRELAVECIPNCRSSLLAHCFNHLVGSCNRIGGYDYFAMLHADIACSENWLGVLIDEMEAMSADVMHAVVAIKDDNGLTSTAVAYSDDEWQCVRRITTKELAELPGSFDIGTIRECYDKNALRLLPNTGCIVMKTGEWFKNFPGFCVLDKIQRIGDDWSVDVVPEDWNFGHWCARNGVKVGATKLVLTKHNGPADYRNDHVWGKDVDWHWVEASVPKDVWEARCTELPVTA